MPPHSIRALPRLNSCHSPYTHASGKDGESALPSIDTTTAERLFTSRNEKTYLMYLRENKLSPYPRFLKKASGLSQRRFAIATLVERLSYHCTVLYSLLGEPLFSKYFSAALRDSSANGVATAYCPQVRQELLSFLDHPEKRNSNSNHILPSFLNVFHAWRIRFKVRIRLTPTFSRPKYLVHRHRHAKNVQPAKRATTQFLSQRTYEADLVVLDRGRTKSFTHLGVTPHHPRSTGGNPSIAKTRPTSRRMTPHMSCNS